VLAVALVLRVACFQASPESMIFPPDSAGYLDSARGLLEHGRLGGEVPDVNRTPGYPLFCGLGLAMGDWRFVVAMQIALDVLTTAVVFGLGRSLAGPRASLFAAGVYACAPLPIVLSCQILTETLSLALLVPSLWLAVALLRGAPRGAGVLPSLTVPCAQRNEVRHGSPQPDAGKMPARHAGGTPAPRPGGTVVLGVLSAAMVMVRPSALVFVAAVGVALLWRAAAWGRTDRREGLRWLTRAAVFGAIVAAAVLPWCVRNERAAGYFGLAGQGPVTYARDWAGLVRAKVDGTSLDEAREAIWRDVLLRAAATDTVDETAPPFDPATMVHRRLYAAMRQEANVVLTQHAGLFVREHVSQSFLALLPPTEPLHLMGANLGEKGTRTVLSQRGLWAAMLYFFEGRVDAMIAYATLALATLALYMLALRGLWRRARGGSWSAVTVLLAFFAVAHFFSGGIATVPRYFLPLLPLTAVLAAVGVGKIPACPLLQDHKTSL